MHRFYCPDAQFSFKTIRITDPNEIHHIIDVLRLKAGDALSIFNSKSQEVRATITVVKAGQVEANIDSLCEADRHQKGKIILACAVPKKAKFEFIIEKCTELGIDEIIPIRTKRTEVVFSKEKMFGKQARFQKVAINAAKQCGRMDVPKIHAMTAISDVLKQLDPSSLAVIPSLNGQPEHISGVLHKNVGKSSLTVFIGPEGDFTPDEVALAVEHGCIPVSLGSTVLKVDTAAISTVAFCKFLRYN